MKHIVVRWAILVGVLSLAVNTVSAEVHAVLPGGSIQEKIDAAVDGDIVAIFGGTYSDDVTVDKEIRLVEVDGEDVTLTGNVLFTGLTNPPPFEGFTVGSSGKGLTLEDTENISLKDVDGTAGTGLHVQGASVVGVIGGSFSAISQDGGVLSATGVNVTGEFSTTINCEGTVGLQTSLGGNYNWRSRRCWLGYSTGRRFIFAGTGGRAVVVGCEFAVNATSTGIYVEGTANHLELANSIVRDVVYYSYKPGAFQLFKFGHCVHISSGNSAYLANNYLHGRNTGNQNGMVFNNHNSSDSMAVGIISSSAEVTTVNNLIVGMSRGVNLPFGATVTNNLFDSVWKPVLGGTVATHSIYGNPLFVVGQTPLLQPSSPAINAGVADPIFNDLDGTRNDIGPGGGCVYDPAGWTTENPIVISFDLAPEQLLKAVDTEVTLSAGKAVAQP